MSIDDKIFEKVKESLGDGNFFKKEFGFKAKTDFQKGLRNTIEHYLKNHNFIR